MSVDKTPSWQERADDLARKLRLEVEVREITEPGMTNAEIAERLSPDLVSMFWRRELNAFFARELGEDDPQEAGYRRYVAAVQRGDLPAEEAP